MENKIPVYGVVKDDGKRDFVSLDYGLMRDIFRRAKELNLEKTYESVRMELRVVAAYGVIVDRM